MAVTLHRTPAGPGWLEVNGKPFVMLGGETHNSVSTSKQAMAPVWEKAVALGLNTVIAPVTWELIEPEEGVFDFTMVDDLLEGARAHGLHLALLWFGTWKNAQSFYLPEWAKRDTARFVRAEVEKGKKQIERWGQPYFTVSYLCKTACEADARAFARFMRYLKESDDAIGTVVMVQVENETGLLGAGREHSDAADAAFASPVPQGFADAMRSCTASMAPDMRRSVEEGAASGTWSEVFGDNAEEIFSAYHVASYVNAVAEAGRAEYDLPTFANCWLDVLFDLGGYPSGGPVSRVAEVWKICAPAIDVHAPDIYVRSYLDVCRDYTRRGDPLLIPETATHAWAGIRAVHAVGHFHALCFAPFGFEDIGLPFSQQQGALFGMDVNDPALAHPMDVDEYGWYNRALQSLMPVIQPLYGTQHLQAVTSEEPEENAMQFGSIRISAERPSFLPQQSNYVCLAARVSEEEFYLIVKGCRLRVTSTDPNRPYAELLALEDGWMNDGKWQRNCRLNGDEASLLFEKQTMLRIKVLQYS